MELAQSLGLQHRPYAQWTDRVVEPREERREEWWIFSRLSRELGLPSVLDLDGEEHKSVTVNPICWVNDGNALLDAVLRGLGAGYLSAFAVKEHLAQGRLAHLIPTLKLPPYDPVYMLYEASDYASPKLEAFKEHLLNTAATLS